MDQLLAAAIPAGVLGGFCAGTPFACSSASRPPRTLSSFMQQHEQEEHDGRLGLGANYSWPSSESLFHGQCDSRPGYPEPCFGSDTKGPCLHSVQNT